MPNPPSADQSASPDETAGMKRLRELVAKDQQAAKATGPRLLAESLCVPQAATPETLQRAKEQDAAKVEFAKAERVNRLASQLGKRYSPTRCDLAAYAIYHDAQKPIVAAVRKLAGRIGESIEHGENLIFLGPVGTGKDFLLAALLYRAAESGALCSWLNGQDLFGGFLDRIDTGESDEPKIKAYALAPVLAISDPIPPVGELGKFPIGNLYRILDRRYRSLRPTWITMNAESEADAESQLSTPVFDRLQHNAIVFRCLWPSYREKK